MAVPPGNSNLVHDLNNCLPVAKRVKLGDWINAVTNAINALSAQNDVALAFNAGAVVLNTTGGTLTVGGSIANGNWFTVTFVASGFPALVSPGLVIGPINIVTGDTTTTVATKLAAAINANLTLTSLGYVATSSAAVVTLKAMGAAGSTTVLTTQLSSGAVITCTDVNPTGGTGVVTSRSNAAFALTPLGNL